MPVIKSEENSLQKQSWFLAARNNQVSIMQNLLQSNFDIETRDHTGRTALHVAAEYGATKVACLLLENNACLDAQMNDDGTPLIDAAAQGHVAMTILLLNKGANIYARDDNEWSIMHWIANENQIALLHVLMQQAVYPLTSLVRSKRWNGITPLHMADSADMVKSLIMLGAPVEAITEEGDTPLMEATLQNRFEVVECLVRHGANILQTNHKGQTALDVAYGRKYNGIIPFFNKTLAEKCRKDSTPTAYGENVTAALAKRDGYVIDELLIVLHASRRIDLLFFTFIAYYRSGLQVHIETTHRQHGKGSGNTVGCHSALLPALWDTQKQRTYSYNTRNIDTNTYRTGILNGTYFENSLNLTTELNKAVNYFDSYIIEGRCKNNLQMRDLALTVLNRVSQGCYDPIEGMNQFLTQMNRHLLKKQEAYFANAEKQTSLIKDRPPIFNAQYKGTFFNACGFDTPQKAPQVIELQEDYIQAQLPLSKEDRIKLKTQPFLFSVEDKKRLYQAAYLRVKQDMDLPVQYQHL